MLFTFVFVKILYVDGITTPKEIEIDFWLFDNRIGAIEVYLFCHFQKDYYFNDFYFDVIRTIYL